MDNILYWLWLSLACTPGKSTFIDLWRKFESPKKIYDADKDEISRVVSSRKKDYSRLINKDTKQAQEILEFCEKHNVGIVTFSSNDFPQSLREIPDPPALLYYRGTLPNFNGSVNIGVVGTRRLSDYGRKNTFKIAYDLALSGAVIVSGMAKGIDGVAHAAALSAGGVTVAVLGSGIDVCYPSEHLTLARGIVKSGCVLTEYPPGTRPLKYNFPVRNRIISGISLKTAVMEGTERSGALLTARYAKEQGKEVFAFPGDVGKSGSELSNLLIRNGATLFTSADEIINKINSSKTKCLNPFILIDSKRPDLIEVLSDYRVCAVTPSDDIFKQPSRSRREKSPINEAENQTKTEAIKVKEASSDNPSELLFDEKTLKIYKQIPLDTDCPIESLIDGEFDLREIMKCLLRLEMGQFVTILPGERVKRKLK